jgi:hypothetical protein
MQLDGLLRNWFWWRACGGVGSAALGGAGAREGRGPGQLARAARAWGVRWPVLMALNRL